MLRSYKDETKLEEMEEKGADALEMAAQENEKGKEKKAAAKMIALFNSKLLYNQMQ